MYYTFNKKFTYTCMHINDFQQHPPTHTMERGGEKLILKEHVAFHQPYIDENVQCHFAIFLSSQPGWPSCGSILPWKASVRELESPIHLSSFITGCLINFWFVIILPVYFLKTSVSIHVVATTVSF